jgi:hypothetical protein
MLFDNCRISGHNRVTGYIEIDVCIRRDENIIANENFPHYDSPGSDPNLIADLRATFFLTPICLANSN